MCYCDYCSSVCNCSIPQLTASVKSIAALVQEKWPDWVGLLQRYGIDTEKLSAHFAALDWKSILQSISSEMNTVISSVANVAGSTVSAIADVAISLVITFYVLIGWRELSSQSKRALYATVRNPLQIEFAIFRNLHMTPMRSFFLVSVSRL